MKKTFLRLGLFSLVSLLSFTACHKEDIKEDKVIIQNVEVDESLQQALNQIGLTYEELINMPLDCKIVKLGEGDFTGEASSQRGDEGLVNAFCCDITGHQFWANGQGPCNYNSGYRFYANSGKLILVTVIQNQLVGNTVTTHNLAAGRLLPVDETCYESSIDIGFEVLDLPGYNYVISNMWIIETGVGVCDHYVETAELPCL